MRNLNLNISSLAILLMYFVNIEIHCQNPNYRTDIDSLVRDYMVIEGDILVPKDFFETKSCYATNFWPNGLVPYVFENNVTQANRDSMILAMGEWETVANVDFIQRTNQSNFIFIENDSGNWSSVGMVGGQQLIGIFNWNIRFIMVHELGHALGFWHEQSRADRDDYIQVNWNCIPENKWHNFDRHSEAGHYGYYDFLSVMHYDQDAFYNSNLPGCTQLHSITVLPPNQSYQNQIGQRQYLSYLDKTTMSFLYPENNWRFVDISYSGSQNGTFLNPVNFFFIGALIVPVGGTIWVQPGTYPLSSGTYSKAMTIKAPLGNVTLY